MDNPLDPRLLDSRPLEFAGRAFVLGTLFTTALRRAATHAPAGSTIATALSGSARVSRWLTIALTAFGAFVVTLTD